MWPLRLVKMSSQHFQKTFPGLLHTPAKCEKNPPYVCEAIAKRNCGSGGVASPMNKQGRGTLKYRQFLEGKYKYTESKYIQPEPQAAIRDKACLI